MRLSNDMMESSSPRIMQGTTATTAADIFRSAYVVEALCVPFFFFDLEGHVTYANSGAHLQFGYGTGELTGLHISALDAGLSGSLWQQVAEAIVQEKQLSYESHAQSQNGMVIPCEFKFQCHDRSDRTFITALVHDISDRKGVEADIIAAREQALEKTRLAEEALERVNQLKLKQDGDYYLTSLLLQPFQVNRTGKSRIRTDWIVRQKTQFAYKKWKSEIGGDICIADEIELRGRPYTFFVIADAMGKANQGACGALLLATIVRTYMARTKKSKQQKNLYPERWLRLLHDELGEGFAGFEGLMMISAVAGLVDQQGHHLYFFNAEQPRPVSYLDGKAGFIGRENAGLKIGMPGEPTEVAIELHTLKPGETIIFGSDGRDDIRLGDDGAINASEELFLSIAESTGGDLKAILQKTQELGEIIDDYSLLSIHLPAGEEKTRRPAASEALFEYFQATGEVNAIERVLERDPHDLRALAVLSNHYLKAGEGESATRYLQRYCDLRPDNLQGIYALIRQYCKLGDYSSAMDIAERITNRVIGAEEGITRKKILTLLAALYRRAGNPRAEIIAAKIR